MDIGYRSSVSDQEQQTNPTQRMEVSMQVTGKGRRHFSELHHSKDSEGLQWLIQAMKDPQAVPWTEKMKLRPQDMTELLSKVANGPQRKRKKALILLGRMWGISIYRLCLTFDTSRPTVSRDWKKFNDMGAEGLFRDRPRRIPKAEDKTIKAAVFSMIHSPPSEHNINRTSWKFEDICRCLSQQGVHVSKNLISKIIRRAGYKWRKAKTVLTSNDPKYREKLDRIKSILSTLGENDRFCSIDEFGPFAVKIK
jgi:transposase